ncbi:MAG: hypothetical protein R3264_14675 [Anaerolineae bacterium]|nr:hypothetical protein [Anaerolineae bacterium]
MALDTILFPGLLVCGFLGIMFLVALGSSFLWLRYVDGRYRRCPECGRKGAGYVVETELVDSRSHIDFKGRSRTRVTVETHNDHYQCEHCQHMWTAKFQKTDRIALKKPK